MKGTYRIRAGTALAALVCVLLLSGCAVGPGARFEGRIGVPVRVAAADTTSYSGTLVGLEDGAFLIDREVPKSEDLKVVRRGGTDYVESAGVIIGTAVEARDLDVVVRQTVPSESVSELFVTTRAYIGWGTGIAAVLAFAAVLAIEEI